MPALPLRATAAAARYRARARPVGPATTETTAPHRLAVRRPPRSRRSSPTAPKRVFILLRHGAAAELLYPGRCCGGKGCGQPPFIWPLTLLTTLGQTLVSAWGAPGLNLCNWDAILLVPDPYTSASGPLPGAQSSSRGKGSALSHWCPWSGRPVGCHRPSGPIGGFGPSPVAVSAAGVGPQSSGVALHLDPVPRGTSR